MGGFDVCGRLFVWDYNEMGQDTFFSQHIYFRHTSQDTFDQFFDFCKVAIIQELRLASRGAPNIFVRQLFLQPNKNGTRSINLQSRWSPWKASIATTFSGFLDIAIWFKLKTKKS